MGSTFAANLIPWRSKGFAGCPEFRPAASGYG